MIYFINQVAKYLLLPFLNLLLYSWVIQTPRNCTSEFSCNPCKRSLVQLSVIGAVLAEGRLLKLVLSSKTLILMIIETHSIWPSIKRHITIISLAKVGSKPPLTKVLLVKLALLLRLPTSCLAASSFLGLASWFGSFQFLKQNCGSWLWIAANLDQYLIDWNLPIFFSGVLTITRYV